MNYSDFLSSKTPRAVSAGFRVDALGQREHLFEWQQAIVQWALRKGKSAIFADTGLGKTRMQLAWAYEVHRHTGRNVLLLAPLAVAQQTVAEGESMGIPVRYCRSQSEVGLGLTITNYEMLPHFDPSQFVGVVLDESSILKSYSGKIRNQIIESFADTPYRLACTATPAPNDYMELGNHAEFVGSMSRVEMLATFFVHDGGDTSEWRLKGHAVWPFWKWVSSWAAAVRKPSDMGYSDEGYDLPELRIEHHELEHESPVGEALFRMEAQTLNEQRAAKRETLEQRIAHAVRLVEAEPGEQWLIWCELNDESEALARAIPGAVEVKGSDSPEHKQQTLLGFASGRVRVLITKPSIAGFGMNWQNCARMIFVSVTHSYEQFYQAVRRCYRFGQQRPVEAHVIFADVERAVVANLERKEREADHMRAQMVRYMRFEDDGQATGRISIPYNPDAGIRFPAWLTSEAS